MGCLSTEYQSSGITGGFTDQMTGPSTATISFKGNGFTSAENARSFAMRRAAEVTLQKGYDYFLIEGGENRFKTQKLSGTIQCNSYGYSTSCNEYGGGTVNKPRSTLDIRMFKGNVPNKTGYYDARYLAP